LDLNFNGDLDLTISPDIDLSLYHFEMVTNLVQAVDTSGVHVGTVTAAASVNGGEMTCDVQTQHFGKVTAKVATNWLDSGGGITMFPRVGAQVFLVFVQGNKNNGVVIGYRSTGNMTAQNPAGSTATEKLKPGSPPMLKSAPSKVVEADSYAPSNANRLGIRGKDGVAEMAVIDDGEPSVSISANNNIYTTAKAQHHSYSSLFLQMVNGDCNIDILGNENKGIAGDNKQSVGGNQELTVMGNQTEHIQGNRTITITGENSVEVTQTWWEKHYKNTTGIKIGTEFTFNANASNKIVVGEFAELKAAIALSVFVGASATFKKSKDVVIKNDGFRFYVEKDQKGTINGKWEIKVGKGLKFEVADNIIHHCKKELKLLGQQNITINSSKANVNIKAKSDVTMNGDCLLLDAKRNIVLKKGSNKFTINPQGIDGKGSLIKFG
jgi:hypothetical protein